MRVLPVPATNEPGVDIMGTHGAPPHRPELAVAPSVRRGERGDVDRVSDGLITRGVDHVAQRLLGVLNAASLGVPVPQEDQLLLLSGPEPTYTLPIHLKHQHIHTSPTGQFVLSSSVL